MRKSLYLFLLLFFCCTVSYAQNGIQTQVKILETYDQIEINDKEATSAKEIKKLYEESKKIDFPEGMLRGLTLLQKVALMNGDYILSGKYSEEAEVLAKQQNDDYALSAIYLYRGKIHTILNKFIEAKASLQKALDFAQKIDNTADQHIQLCRIYANIAGMSEGTGENQNWYKYTVKSLKAIETTPTGDLTDYQKSKYYYLYIFELMNMGSYYVYGQKPPDFQKAEPYFVKTLEFESNAPEYFRLCDMDVYYSLSSFYLEKGDYQKSIDYAQKILQIEKSKNSPRERLFAYENIKNAYQKLKIDAEENKYLRLYTALNDSIISSEKKAIVNQSRVEIKKSDVKNEQSKRTFLWIGAGLILSMALVSWFAVRRKNMILRKNYQLMIDKLKNEPVPPSTETTAVFDDQIMVNEPETVTMEESETSANRNLISTETEARILRRLSAFERSEKFLRKEMNIGLLSAQLNTNSKYLSEVIKKNRSPNFSNYINHLRINYIVHKLYSEPKYREYKISYLAEECGYASPQVFVLAFKKTHGVTPSYFIDSLKEDQTLVNH